jgi:hypothetical protein
MNLKGLGYTDDQPNSLEDLHFHKNHISKERLSCALLIFLISQDLLCSG